MTKFHIYNFESETSLERGVPDIPLGGIIHIISTQRSLVLLQTGIQDIPTLLSTEGAFVDLDRGGVSYNTDTDYQHGDVVTYNNLIYSNVSPTGSYGVVPGTDSSVWQTSSKSIWDPGDVYKEGDIVAYKDNLYIAPPGGVPKGDNPGKKPTVWIKSTRGGEKWDSQASYVLGDVVVYNNETYTKLNSNDSRPPSADWKIINRTGTVWDSEVNYKGGDVVSVNDNLYIAPSGGVTKGNNPTSKPSMWIKSTRGGELWDSNASYVLGDVVVHNNETYTKLNSNDSMPPSADWKIVNRTGTVWDSAVQYKTGDIVSHNSRLYIAKTNTKGNSPNTSTTQWKNTDRVGIAWAAATTYVSGDIISYSGKLYIAKTTTKGHTPSSSPSQWINLEKDLDAKYDKRYVNVTGDTMTGALNLPANAGSNTQAVRAQSYATNTMGGTVKMRVAGSTLYITNNGNNA